MNDLPPEDLRPTRPLSILFGPLGVARVLVHIFSSTTGQRDPPSPNKKDHIRLITIGVSHFCEKARWGLDLLEQNNESPIYYTEDAHPPAFLAFATLPASNNKASTSPMVVCKPDSSVLYKSNVILQELCPFLYPEEIQQDIIAMELDLGTRLGASVRCVAYHYLLQKEYHPVCVKMVTGKTSKVETVLFEKMLPNGIDRAMRDLIQVNESTSAASALAIRKVFSDLSKRLEENSGKKGLYLMDTKAKSFGFTAADLAFAALSYPLIRPPEMWDFSADDSELPPELVSLGNDLRATTAGQHVLQMYKRHRLAPGCTKVEIKTAGRDRNPLQGFLYSVGVAGAAIGAIIWYRRQQ
jgi:glutathione S-transferase